MMVFDCVAMELALLLYNSELMRSRCLPSIRPSDRGHSAGMTHRTMGMEMIFHSALLLGGQSNESKKEGAIAGGRCRQHNDSK